MNRDQILEAAALIFRTKGFHAASMQDIAEAVNLQKASLYHHVNSKQEILLNLLDRALDVVTERVSAGLGQSNDPLERLRLAVSAYLATIIEYRDLAFVLLLEYRSLDDAYQARHIPRRDRFERIWRDLLIEGQQSGQFKIDDPSLAARALLGQMNWTITWFRPDGPQRIEDVSEAYVGLLFNGILHPNGNSND